MTSEAEKSTMETCELENRYRDFSRLMTTKASEGQTTGEATGHSTKATSGTTGGNGNLSDQNFPVKLHFLLAELESVGLSHIASWQPHGRSFKVHKQNEFVNLLLRRWFRQTKIASFQRQLNIYAFHRITSGPDKGAYYHELFLRGKGSLACQIPRMKLKGTGPRRPGSSETEPNFYIMPFLETPALGMEAKEAPRGTTTNSSAALATDLTKNVGRSTPQESTAAMFGPCSYSSILPSPSIETLLQYCGLPSSNAASVSPSYMRLPSCSCRSVLPPSSMEALLLYQGYGLPSSNLASAPTSYVAALSSQVDAHNTIYGNSNAASLTSFLSSKTTLGLPSSFSQGNMSVSPTLAQALFMQSEAHRRRAAAAVRSPAVDVVLANEYWHQPVARGATNQSAAAAEL